MATFEIGYTPNRFPEGIPPSAGHDFSFLLTKDNWNDFGYRTTCDIHVWVQTEWQRFGSVRVLVEGLTDTHDAFSAPPANQPVWQFMLPNRTFISLGTDLDYYKAIRSLFASDDDLEAFLSRMQDVVFLERFRQGDPALRLRQSEPFQKSLLRESPAQKAYAEAGSVLFGAQAAKNFRFRLTFQLPRFSAPHVVDFEFDPLSPLPQNIVVWIGKNGAGKTRGLVTLVESLLGGRPSGLTGQPSQTSSLLEPFPRFAHIIAVSYSPFDTFPIRIEDSEASDETRAAVSSGLATDSRAYTYCGARTLQGWHGLPLAWQRTCESLLSVLQQDHHPLSADWLPKFPTLLQVLREGLEYAPVVRLLDSQAVLNSTLAPAVLQLGPIGYLDIEAALDINRDMTLEVAMTSTDKSAVYFRSGASILPLSAGQAMFAFLAINVIAGIKFESIVVIDEPELCLHPNLEIVYLRMLKRLLRAFRSYAVIATHSTYIAREVPANCVRVFREPEAGIPHVSPPPLETFGGDLSLIANYVFDNLLERKPFEEWLLKLAQEAGGFDPFLARLGQMLNPESIAFVRNELAGRGFINRGGA